jgi:hypothetical protein
MDPFSCVCVLTSIAGGLGHGAMLASNLLRLM